jgi:hypothetical protein
MQYITYGVLATTREGTEGKRSVYEEHIQVLGRTITLLAKNPNMSG